MESVASLLSRPGLAGADRVIVGALAEVFPGRFDRLQEWARAARDLSVPRDAVAEILLQSVLFCGFPRTISAFEALAAAWPGAAPADAQTTPAAERIARGDALFASIYGGITESVHTMLRRHHPELHDFVIESAYGRILSRTGLSTRLRELAGTAALAASDQIPQMVGHARGAMRHGATPLEVAEAVHTAIGDPVATAALVRRIRL
jgi:alkylhydroperoxidase/carboxymuconolactone decarboxylase family protein YurZ